MIDVNDPSTLKGFTLLGVLSTVERLRESMRTKREEERCKVVQDAVGNAKYTPDSLMERLFHLKNLVEALEKMARVNDGKNNAQAETARA